MSDELWREHLREYHRKWRASRPREDYEADLARRRQRRRERIANETPEEREARMRAHREYMRTYLPKRRARETPEQHEARLAKQREYRRKRKASK